MNRTFCRDGFKDGVHGHWQFWYEGSIPIKYRIDPDTP